MRERVFHDQLGKWPQVYRTGPGRFELIARHKNPGAFSLLNMISMGITLLVLYWLVLKITKENWGFIFVGVLMGLVLIPMAVRAILHDLPFLTARTTRVSFNGGEICWRGRKGPQRIEADMPRNFRVERHYKAGAEARAGQRSQNSRPSTLYQTSSEVFIDTGENWMHACPVAEIACDESGETAHQLSAALRFVDSQASREAGHGVKAATAARISLD